MSYKATFSNVGHQNSIHEKLHSTPSTEEKIKFAGDESKDRLYEPKQNKKMVRVLTVVIYIFSVSLAAIMLSLYYVFFWNPPDYATHKMRADNVTNVNTPENPTCLGTHEPGSNPVTETATLPFQSQDSFTENDPNKDDVSNLVLVPMNDTESVSSPETTTEEVKITTMSLLFPNITANSIDDEKQPNNT